MQTQSKENETRQDDKEWIVLSLVALQNPRAIKNWHSDKIPNKIKDVLKGPQFHCTLGVVQLSADTD